MPLKILFRPHQAGRARPLRTRASRTVTAAISIALAILCFAATTSGALAGKAAPARPECATSDRTDCGERQQALPRQQAAELKRRLVRHIAHFVEYPRPSQYRREAGASLTAFVVGPTGQVSNIRTVRSSGFSDLDRSARQAIMAASPIPADLIGDLRHDSEFSVPISFRQIW